MAVFEGSGFDFIAPDILQPADIFLERSGEDIRARTFVFTDPSGVELCLRPDLTVPTCRYHLSHQRRSRKRRAIAIRAGLPLPAGWRMASSQRIRSSRARMVGRRDPEPPRRRCSI